MSKFTGCANRAEEGKARRNKGEEQVIAVGGYKFYVTPFYLSEGAPALEEHVSNIVKDRAFCTLERHKNC